MATKAPKKTTSGNKGGNKGVHPGSENLIPWKPGQSGNPSGRPLKKPITEIFERIMNNPELVAGFEEAIAKSIRKGGMAGVMYMKEAADRIEGKVTQPIAADVSVNLADAIAEARKRAGR